MSHKALIIKSGFSSHEIADAHRATGCQNPPDWKRIWELLNGPIRVAGENTEFWQTGRDAIITRRRQEAR